MTNLKKNYNLLKSAGLRPYQAPHQSLLFWLENCQGEMINECVDAINNIKTAKEATELDYETHIYKFVRELPVEEKPWHKKVSFVSKTLSKVKSLFGIEHKQEEQEINPALFENVPVHTLFKGNMFKEHLEANHTLRLCQKEANLFWGNSHEDVIKGFVNKLSCIDEYHKDIEARESILRKLKNCFPNKDKGRKIPHGVVESATYTN